MSEVTSHAEVEPTDLGLLMGNSFTGFVDPSSWAVLGSGGKIAPRWHLEAHFGLFWALVAK